MMILRPGAIVDGFTLGPQLHTGGMATLWRVTHPDIAAPVLMKIPTLLSDPTAIVGFEMEEMILPRLVGRSAPRCYAVGDLARQPYLVMEDIGGRSLLSLIDQAPLPVETLRDIGAKTAGALADLHAQNVLHLDVKPSNVMLRETGEAALVDFGLSRHLRMPDLLAEELRVPVGTGPYISPEQLRRDRSDPRSDIFALGVLLYHLAVARRPFGQPTTLSGLRERFWRAPAPLRALQPQLPPWFQEVVLRCLEIDPAARYQSAAQLRFDLQNPNQIVLTERAERVRPASSAAILRRRVAYLRARAAGEISAAPKPPDAPIVVAAVDLGDGGENLADAVRAMTGRILETAPAARLACVAVMKTGRVFEAGAADAEGRNRHVQMMVELRAWARPLQKGARNVTIHVLEEPNVADAIVAFARESRADQIVLGARGASSLRRYLGSVSARVAATAPCAVTIVRLPQARES
ncbi:MAG: protein kinase [Hyphomicrobiales bacterium]|nr:protein kinase [Hyphomicrobiales bacterium]